MVVYMALATASEQHVRVFVLLLCRVAMGQRPAICLVACASVNAAPARASAQENLPLYTQLACPHVSNHNYINTENTIGMIRLLNSKLDGEASSLYI